MGNQLSQRVAGGFPDVRSCLLDLEGNYVHEANLGGGKVLKTMKCGVDEGQVTVKVYFKREGDPPLSNYEAALKHLSVAFDTRSHPGILPFRRFFETPKAAYLVRQFINRDLYDRFHVPPFLCRMEKLWLAYQVLRAVEQAHKMGVTHGDIKSENILVTSYSWMFLTDFAVHKPASMPADNPADFAFYFDSGQRRRCYVAPERFYTSNDQRLSQVSVAADIFSVGCVIAEMFLNGKALFDLPQLLAYKDGKYDPTKIIAEIPDQGVRDLILDMTQLDPAKRSTAADYLERTSGALFPSYFRFIYRFCSKLLQPEYSPPDAKIRLLSHHFPRILHEICDYKGPIYPPSLGPSPSSASASASTSTSISAPGASPTSPRSGPPPPSRSPTLSPTHTAHQQRLSPGEFEDSSRALQAFLEAVKAHSSTPSSTPASVDTNTTNNASTSRATPPPPPPPPARSTTMDASVLLHDRDDNGVVIMSSVVCACLRNVRFPTAKLTALELLIGFGGFVSSEHVLARLVPYTISLLTDHTPTVRYSAVHTLARLLSMVRTVQPKDGFVFPEYILPALSLLPSDPEELVRIAYAQNITNFAETAKRLLDIANFTKQVSWRAEQALSTAATEEGEGESREGGGTTDLHAKIASQSVTSRQVPYQGTYDADLTSLQDAVGRVVVAMLTTGTARVKRALLADITRLCVFFGRQRTNDFVLPLLITVLNDRDWQLRAAFFDGIPGVSVFVGRVSLENFILPCIEQGLVDVEEYVIQRSLSAFRALCRLRLFQSHTLLDVCQKVSPLLCHPSTWLRNAAVSFMSVAAAHMGLAHSQSFLVPLLRDYLVPDAKLILVDSSSLLQQLRSPISRRAFETALKLSAAQHSGANVSDTTQLPASLKESAIPPGMQQYLRMVAATVQQKMDMWQWEKKNSPLDSSTFDPEDLIRYERLSHTTQLYTVGVPPTRSSTSVSPDQSPTLAPGGSSSNQQQQQQQPLSPPSVTSKINWSSIRDAPSSALSTDAQPTGHILERHARTSHASQPQPGVSVRLAPIRQAVHTLPVSLQKALGVPPGPPKLGVLEREPLRRIPSEQPWRPRRVLSAQLKGHEGAVNQMAVSADDKFLVSGGDDGIVRLWDVQLMAGTASVDHSLLYQAQSGRITSVCVLQQSHSVASADDRGALHVFRVEHTQRTSEYTGVSTLRNLQEDSGIVRVVHFSTATESLLVYATRGGAVRAWDMRAHREAWHLSMDPHLGVITCLAVGPSPYFCLVGTDRGFIVCWDTRLQLLVQLWRHSNKSRILSLTPFEGGTVLPADAPLQHPVSGPVVFVSAQGSGEVQSFDLTTGETRHCFRVMSSNPSQLLASLSDQASLRKVTPQRQSSLSSLTKEPSSRRLKPTISMLSQSGLRSYLSKVGPSRPSSLYGAAVSAEKAIYRWRDLDMPSFHQELSGLCNRFGQTPVGVSSFLFEPGSFALTASSGASVVRYWDLKQPSDSFRVVSPPCEPRQKVVFNAHMENGVTVFEECVQTSHAPQNSSASRRRHVGPMATPNHHRAALSDMVLVRRPLPMLVTASVDGSMRVWV